MLKTIIGKKAVLDALKSSIKLEKIVLLKSKLYPEIIHLANQKKIQIEFWTLDQFNRYFKNRNLNHQFCFAFLIDEQKPFTVEELISHGKQMVNPIVVILDEINDPQNFGAIIRTCVAANVLGIVHKKNHQSPQNHLTIKASMGTNALLPIISVTNLMNTINLFKKNDYWILVTSTSQQAIPYYEVPKQRSYILVVGNEANGVGKLIQNNADYLITIPLKGKVQSLNVSVATGIILFDLIKE